MKVRISGYGGASAAEQEIDWPFAVPPVANMRVRWTDGSGNLRHGTVNLVTYDVDQKAIIVSVLLT